MIVFDQERLDLLLGRFTSGFGGTPLQTILFFAIVFGIVVFFVISYRIIRQREQRRLEGRIEELNEYAFEKHALDPDERRLVDVLARHLKDARKAYLLLSDPYTFTAALQAARAEGSVDSDATSSLQKKLGIDPSRHVRRIRTTRDLADGLEVIIATPGSDRRVSGVVRGHTEAGLVVELTRRIHPSAGASAALYFHDRRGIFAFATRIVDTKPTSVTLAHSHSLKQAQRRNYVRSLVDTRVVIKRVAVADEDEASFPTRLIDLSGGGASCANPEDRLAVGDDLMLYLTRGDQEWMPISGEVVRLSSGGSVAHLRFGHIDESTRDHIIRIVHSGLK